MTLARKRSLELVRLLLEDAAADPALLVGSRERLTIMAGRVRIEVEMIESISPTPVEDIPQAARGQYRHDQPVREKCTGGFKHHRWDGVGDRCSRCGYFR